MEKDHKMTCHTNITADQSDSMWPDVVLRSSRMGKVFGAILKGDQLNFQLCFCLITALTF